MAKRDIKLAVHGCSLNEPATEDEVASFERGIGIRLPPTYRELMLYSNGVEGAIGKDRYLVLWPIDQLAELNDAYCVSDFAPGLVLIGSDGGDTGYAFDTRTEDLRIVEVPFIGMSIDDVRYRSGNIIDFLMQLQRE